MSHNSILIDNHHGFRASRPCETQLLQVVNDWSESLDAGDSVSVIYLDISRAFDSIPHSPLLKKLYKIGISGIILTWVEAFLWYRNQQVINNDFKSSYVRVSSGVPQGIILGPILFLIYINDIVLDLNSHGKLYADDCVLYRRIGSKEDTVILQKDLETTHQWSETC